MNLEKAYCIKLSSLVNRLFCSFGAKKGRKEQYFLYQSYILSSTIGKNSEAEKLISS